MRYEKNFKIYIQTEGLEYYGQNLSMQRLEETIKGLQRELAELSLELFEDDFNPNNHMRTISEFTVTDQGVFRNIRNQPKEYREKFEGEQR